MPSHRLAVFLLLVALTAEAAAQSDALPAHTEELRLRESGQLRTVWLEHLGDHRYRIRKATPALSADEDLRLTLRGLWTRIEPEGILELGLGGKRLLHPDVARLRELLTALDRDPPDPVAVVAGMPRLARLESRSRALAAAAAVEPLSAMACDALRRALIEDFDVRTPGAYTPGGSPDDEALEALLTALAGHPSLDAPAAVGLLDASPRLRTYRGRHAVLQRLDRPPLLTVAAVVRYAQRHLSTRELTATLSRCAARPELSSAEANTILAALPDLNTYDSRAALLEALDDRGLLTVETVLRQTLRYLGGDHVEGVLLRLAQRDPLSLQDATRVLEASPELDTYVARLQVLELLDERGLLGFERVLAYAGRYLGGGEFSATLDRLAARETLSRDEALALLAASSDLDTYPARRALLLAVDRPGLLSVKEVLAYADRYLGGPEYRDTLTRLQQREPLNRDAAAQLLSASTDLDTYAQRAGVLKALERRGLLTVRQILTYADRYLGGEEFREALTRLTQRQGLTSSEADAVLSASTDIDTYARRAAVLRALDERELLGVKQILVYAQRHLGGAEFRAALDSLCARPRLTPADAAAVLESSTDLDTYDARAAILTALTERDLIDVPAAVRYTRRFLGSAVAEQTLLAQAERAATAAEAAAVAACVTEFDTYAARTKLLLALVGKLPADDFGPHLRHLDDHHAQTVRDALPR